TATNVIGSDDEVFAIDVSGPPVILSSPPVDAEVGEAFFFTVIASGGPPPTFSMNGNPAWMSIDANSGEISGTPQPGDEGPSATISIVVSNTHGSDSQPFTMEVFRAPAF